MNLANVQRPQPIRNEQLAQLMHQLRVHAGITIESPSSVIAHYVQERMVALQMETVDAYLALFDNSISARAEWLALVDLLTVKETRFFRQSEALACVSAHLKTLMEGGPAPREVSFWSAGCSTGQEAYSIAMVVEDILRRYAPWLEWHGVGTDISFQAVSKAQQGCYPELYIQGVPGHYRKNYLEDAGDGQYRLSADILARTHFLHSNLLHVNSVPFSDFNIIYCQNVLIYFEREKQRWIIDQLVDRLQPGGLLILGAGEDVRWTHASMRRVNWPGVTAYKKIGGCLNDH